MPLPLELGVKALNKTNWDEMQIRVLHIKYACTQNQLNIIVHAALRGGRAALSGIAFI